MFKKIILVILGVLLALLATEIYLRTTKPKVQTTDYKPAGTFSCYVPGTYYWAEIKPNANCVLHSNTGDFADLKIKTNSLGLRDKEIPFNKPAGIKRVLFIGDSFTFGWGVADNQSYPKITEQILKQKGVKIEVINAGRPSTSPGNYYLYLKNEGIKFNSDIVVIGFDVFNDLSNSSNNEIWAERDSNGLPSKIVYPNFYVGPDGNLINGAPPLSSRISVLSNSYLFNLISDFFFPGKIDINKKPLGNELEGENYIELLFKTANDQVKKRGKKLIILMIPDSIQVDEQIRRTNGLPEFASPYNPVYLEFAGFFEKNGIDYLNLLPDFLKSRDRNNLYYENDGHWNKNGQKLAAELISEKILKYLK